MKNKITKKYYLVVWLAALTAIFSACNDPSDLGMELLPSTDLVEVKNVEKKEGISAFTVREDSIRTDEATKSLLGSLYDPVFGKTNINFAAQLRLQNFPDFGTNAVVDSVKMFLYYRKMYGDTVTPQTIRVYELESSLDYDQSYTQNVDLKAMASNQLIGEIDYTPVIRIDSAYADTIYQLISIPLDHFLGEKLINADSLVMTDNDLFLEYFKGLFFEVEEQSSVGGSILTLEALSQVGFSGSALAVYYNNDENISSGDPDTLYTGYVINEFSARVNSIDHNYSGTPFETSLNTQSGEDSLIYIQSTGGLESKIEIEDLSTWRDSTNTAINKAELVFYVDTLASDFRKYPPPSQLLFTFINEDGVEELPDDYWFSAEFYDGFLRTSDYTYRFNITQHLQNILDGTVVNNGFYLTTPRKSSEANRVVLKGSSSQKGIQLNVTYSKYLQ